MENCPGECVISGDPHFQTFDGKQFSVLSPCESILVHPNPEATNYPGEKVYIWYTNRACSPDTSCGKIVTVRYGTHNIVLEHNKVKYQGTYIMLPHKENGLVIRKASSLFVKVEMDNGMEIMWDYFSIFRIQAPKSFMGKVSSLKYLFHIFC